jgi:hypothetical protein
MVRTLRRFVLFLSIIAFASGESGVAANPVGEFFKRVGRSISNLGRSPTPTPTPQRLREDTQRGETVADKKDMPNHPSAMPFVTPTPTPMEVRPATVAPPDRRRSRDLPYGVAVLNRPGLVTSPYAPNQGLVDVRAFPKSTEVMDPFTGKVFLTP